jgi:hypothetical protein
VKFTRPVLTWRFNHGSSVNGDVGSFADFGGRPELADSQVNVFLKASRKEKTTYVYVEWLDRMKGTVNKLRMQQRLAAWPDRHD